MVTRSGLSSHMFIMLIMLALAGLVAGCATPPSDNQRLWRAYATVLPIAVSKKDTEVTKKQVYQANSLHEGVGRGATGSP